MDPIVRAQVTLFWEVCDLDTTRLEVWTGKPQMRVLDSRYIGNFLWNGCFYCQIINSMRTGTLSYSSLYP